ncbi:hypothetical protein EDB85DRAFT_2189308 [Lactarius pseudohatsudake]|nr:hypothetical protein EDB85DRAFT_2189308 [Lactarius pseudohatsudake]
MSETTQILFNSPALHSLKRDQLVKLCKIHSIKASGKNVDLVQRLKDHALTLPPDDPLSVAIHTDGQDEESSTLDLKRPSDQWEVVMEDIPEVPETVSRTTLSSLRSVTTNAPDEFGTGGGSKSSSMSSSLKAIANSFNFKRATSAKSIHSVPYSSIPETLPSDMPQTDHFKFSTPDTTIQEHISSHPAPPGTHPLTNAAPHPTATQSKTTIRLVSASATTPSLSHEPGTPHLKPVDLEFDLVMGSPNPKGQSRVPVWPLSPHPAPSERLYPTLPVDELEQNEKETKSAIPGAIALPQRTAGSTSKPKRYPRPSNNVQDLFSPAPKLPSAQKESLGIPRSEPFLFGSPLPRHSVSNKAFDAAAASVLEEMNKRLSAAGVQKVDADAHDEQFNKMDSIATHYAARRESKKRKSDVLGHGSAPGKKRSSADTRVISAGSRKRMGIPGGFDDDEEEEALPGDVQEEEDRRMSKRVRLLEGDGGKDKGRRLTLSPRKTEAEEKQAEKERAATRKMLDARKEKRRSSRHGRLSTAGPQASNNKGKAKPRFGFLSSAKSIVRSVWNFGAGSPTKAPQTTTTTTMAITKPQTSGIEVDSKKTVPGPPKKPSLPASRPSESLVGRKSTAPTRTTTQFHIRLPVQQEQSDESPIRKFVEQYGGEALEPYTGGIDQLSPERACWLSQQRLIPWHEGERSQRRAAPGPTSNGPGATKTAAEEADADIFSPSRATATSRLFAPTASSLAKTRSPAATTTGAVAQSRTSTIVAQRAKTPPRNSALDAITNSPRGGSGNPNSAGKIFSTPLLAVPPPVRPTSLAAAAAAVMAASGDGPLSPGRASPAKPATGGQLHARKPRISRSRIIAKLGAQRAAAAASSSSSIASSVSRPVAARGSSKIPARASGSGAVRTPAGTVEHGRGGEALVRWCEEREPRERRVDEREETRETERVYSEA